VRLRKVVGEELWRRYRWLFAVGGGLQGIPAAVGIVAIGNEEGGLKAMMRQRIACLALLWLRYGVGRRSRGTWR
jgi:hypothetical protein